jgi:hypothetical protein
LRRITLFGKRMIRRAYIVVFLALCSVACADESIKLEGTQWVRQQESVGVVEHYVEVVVIALDVSQQPVTVSTKFSKGPTCLSLTGHALQRLCYYAGNWESNGLRTHPSPYIFCPVTLLPGERTELEVYRRTLASASHVTKLTYIVGVDEAYGRRYGWWTGKAEVELLPVDYADTIRK